MLTEFVESQQFDSQSCLQPTVWQSLTFRVTDADVAHRKIKEDGEVIESMSKAKAEILEVFKLSKSSNLTHCR